MILWYILLEKQSVILALYRSLGTEKQKMITFLSNDFKTERWKSAALKNAYVLMSKKDYIMAAAFFLLGDSLKDCVDLVVQSLGDIQLGILICRIKESIFSKKMEDKPLLRGLISDYFVTKGYKIKDPWMVSIGYSLLNQYIKSLNCFIEVSNDKPDLEYSVNDWPDTFAPSPSGFHPSAFILQHLLANNFKVKRELEGGETTREESNSIFDDFFASSSPTEEKKPVSLYDKLDGNMDKILKNSYYYYLNSDQPFFGISGAINYREKKEDFQGLTRLLYFHFVDQLLFSCIEKADWSLYFEDLRAQLQGLFPETGPIALPEVWEHVEVQVRKLKNPKFLVAWLLGTKRLDRALVAIELLALEVSRGVEGRSRACVCS